jgi:hypothetical protein
VATAVAWHWRADRRAVEVYVIAVGSAATVWTAAAWWASPWHDWLVSTAVLRAGGIPRWWLPGDPPVTPAEFEKRLYPLSIRHLVAFGEVLLCTGPGPYRIVIVAPSGQTLERTIAG